MPAVLLDFSSPVSFLPALRLVPAGLLDFSSPVQFSASAVTLRWPYALDRLLTPRDSPTVPVNTLSRSGPVTCLNRCEAVLPVNRCKAVLPVSTGVRQFYLSEQVQGNFT